jgi:putative hydrolase of the HAD superfamily
MKVDRSELGRYFAHTAIVKEKDAAAYSRLVTERELARDSTWMIGNSPKSDINPALEAGLNAVLVPHPHTWVLEHQDLRESGDGKFLRVERFTDLRLHF